MSDLRVSATLYTTWKRCPAQAAARLAGHYPAETVAAFKGLLAHRIFARHLAKGHVAPSGFRQACRQEIGSSQLNWKMRDLGLKAADINGIIDEVAGLYRTFTSAKPVGEPEVHLEYQLTEGVTMIGTIDSVNMQAGDYAHARLTDWKTGELGEAEAQMRFYATLWTLVHGVRPLTVEAVSVATGERYEEWIPAKKDYPDEHDRLADPILSTTLEVAELVADLTTPGSIEDPGPWCQWCPILKTCDQGQRTVRMIG